MRKLLTGQRPYTLTTIAAAAVALLLAVPLWWIMDDSIPVVVYRIEVTNSPVTPGETLEMVFHGDRFKYCPTYVEEEFVDGNNLVHPVKERLGRIDRQPGPFSIPFSVPTPLDAAPGRALYRSTVRYACSPLGRIWPVIVHREAPFVFAALSSM